MWEASISTDEPRRCITSAARQRWICAARASAQNLPAPDKEVWVVAGDGGFQMTAAELATIVQEKIKINIAIINRLPGHGAAVAGAFLRAQLRIHAARSPDFAKLADAHGIPGRAVHKRSELDSAVKEARSAPGAYLLNFMVEKEDSVYPMIPAGSALHEMIRRPDHDPLEETADDK